MLQYESQINLIPDLHITFYSTNIWSLAWVYTLALRSGDRRKARKTYHRVIGHGPFSPLASPVLSEAFHIIPFTRPVARQ